MKRFLSASIICLICVPAFAQIPGLPRVLPGGGTPAAAPGAASSTGEDDFNEGTIQSYLEMRAFGEGLYNRLELGGDSPRISDFKRKVDAAFEAASKEDMQRAYEMNVSAKSEVRYVLEDRFKVYKGLYDNPIVQELANRVGQSIVSPKVTRLYTFKLVADPVPWAEALSTGTVWVSTGMVASTKNKAQLGYVLAHEAAHIYLEHHKQRLLLQYAQEEYNRQQTANGESRQRRWNFIGSGVGLVGGLFLGGDVVNARQGADLGSILASALAQAGRPRTLESIEWNRFEEDEADRLAFEWLLDQNMDVTQVPDVFLTLRNLGERDPRVKLGFLGRTDRVRDRLSSSQARIEAEKALPTWSSRRLQRSDPDFDLLLAEVQRDNGVFALHYDMLETARDNLQGAVRVKTQDPTALYFYGKALLMTARTEEERKEADRYFQLAAENDYRFQNYGSYLHRAIAKLTAADANATDKSVAVDLLKRYVIGYHYSAALSAREEGYKLPPHLDQVYDYLARAGEVQWKIDDAVIKRASDALDAGIPLGEYRDTPAPRGIAATPQGGATATPAPPQPPAATGAQPPGPRGAPASTPPAPPRAQPTKTR